MYVDVVASMCRGGCIVGNYLPSLGQVVEVCQHCAFQATWSRRASNYGWHFGRSGFAVVIVMLLSSLLSSSLPSWLLHGTPPRSCLAWFGLVWFGSVRNGLVNHFPHLQCHLRFDFLCSAAVTPRWVCSKSPTKSRVLAHHCYGFDRAFVHFVFAN